LQKEDQLVS